MSMSNLLAMRSSMPKSLSMDLSPAALNAWNPSLKAAEKDAESENTISILDVIGYDWWTGTGVTASRIAAALRSIGANNPVTVYINSPGGDLFEGLAIYSLLQEHKAPVTVKVIGVAASSASVIAMGATDLQISRAAFLMVHNSWVYAGGNRHELREVADWLEPFDYGMADLYAHRSGQDIKSMQKLMDAESWLGGAKSVELGLADSVIDYTADEAEANAQASALRKMDVALARAGMSRGERRNLMSEFSAGKPGAAGASKPSATGENAGKPSLNLQFGSLAAALRN